MGFPHSSVGKESTCNAEDPSSLPGSAGEGIGYPLQYSWASLMVQLINNLPAMWEIWVRSLGWEDPLEKRMATHPLQYSCLENSMDYTVHEVTKSQTWLSDFHFLIINDVEHLFMCLLVTCISSLEKCVFKSSHFLNNFF